MNNYSRYPVNMMQAIKINEAEHMCQGLTNILDGTTPGYLENVWFKWERSQLPKVEVDESIIDLEDVVLYMANHLGLLVLSMSFKSQSLLVRDKKTGAHGYWSYDEIWRAYCAYIDSK